MTNPSTIPVNCSRGAPMGRSSCHRLSDNVTLSNVVLNSGGYDEGGAYWGARFGGTTLFVAHCDEGGCVYFDASSWQEAEREVKSGNDQATITRELQTSFLYWHGHDCDDCEGGTSPSECEESAICDCGAFIDKEHIFHTESEIYTPDIREK